MEHEHPTVAGIREIIARERADLDLSDVPDAWIEREIADGKGQAPYALALSIADRIAEGLHRGAAA